MGFFLPHVELTVKGKSRGIRNGNCTSADRVEHRAGAEPTLELRQEGGVS